jgi:fructokinase
MSIICIGAVLWDVFERERHIGGAPFNVAAHARQAGAEVHFISGVGDDALGREALTRAAELGIDTRYVRIVPETPTGTVDIFLVNGQPDFTINRPAAYDHPRLSADALAELAATNPQCIYFGTLEQMSADVRRVTKELLTAFPRARRFYDINLRKNSFSPELVEELLGDATVVKLNDDEMDVLSGFFELPTTDIREFAATFASRFQLETVCVTRGAEGCALWHQGDYAEAPGAPANLVDAVGAGDAFCAMMMVQLLQAQLSLLEIGAAANRLGAYVASHAGAVPAWTWDDIQ